MIFTESGYFCDFIKCYVLSAMCIDILTDRQKTLQIFLLLVSADIKMTTAGSMMSSNNDKYFKHFGVDHGF